MSVPSRSHGVRVIRAKRSDADRAVFLPAQGVIHNEVVSAATLLISAAMALAWANSPWAESYHALRDFPVSLTFGKLTIAEDLHHWVNDGLMAVFFFVMGLEIKRELVQGELAHWRRAAFPISAALGGMGLPAGIYLAFNAGGDGLRGWGIPMATDIAFALGIMALLGKRIPPQLRIFLMAVAIADDIGAILVIALFYTPQVSLGALGAAAGLLLLILLMIRLGLRTPLPYLVTAFLFWAAVLESGVHATIAGVVLGLVTPAGRWFSEETFTRSAGAHLEALEETRQGDRERAGRLLGQIEELARQTETPVDRLQRLTHPWVSFLVLPLFAVVNAGVVLSAAGLGEALASPVTQGVFAGLLAGKTLGILAFAWLAVWLQVATMPDGLGWRQVAGVAVLGGIGFTVALFITDLAFHGRDLMNQAKVGTLAASLLAGAAGYVLLRFWGAAEKERVASSSE